MINEIIIATGNIHKIKEIKFILKDLSFKIISMTSFHLWPVIVENGRTFEENASKKAISAALFFKKWALADDSGVEVDCLNGDPGVYSARYAGKKCNSNENNEKLLRVLKNIPIEKRTAKFKSSIAVANPKGEIILLENGEIFGKIVESIGICGFGYDSVFYIDKYKKTLSELNFNVKNSISHRAKALQKIKKKLIKYMYGK
ncbi:MAG: RdgB/HAM1 family non-canonical purine NTP pyrophosphatase [Endomicrobium sp.]|jgi:XTP/dITP diphosphohydrolase|nr:RdgB/HAM1 family non-canonical purine NTP pyrophosphatase [Endomicrobium sp.]